MTEEIYVAKKSPHSNGPARCGFHNLDDAKSFVEDATCREPEVTEAAWHDNRIDDPGWTYEVVIGVGKVAGTVTRVPMVNTDD